MLDVNDTDAIRAYIDGADRYFQDLESPEALFDKPYVPQSAAGYNVARLGYLLAHLKHGPSHIVLDFGAGLGWLSVLLARLGCRVVALDVSPTAIKLCEAALQHAQLPPFAPRPQFRVYDGFRFPLPDESVDRIACYDAMHHVPNKRTVLRKMYRVLRRGGLACFVEPGPGHAGSPDSVHDTDRWGVLEDEIDGAQLCEVAEEAGFAETRAVPLVHPRDHLMTASDFRQLHRGARQGALDWYGTDSLVVAVKGKHPPDSQYPGQLKARIDVLELPESLEPGQEFTATVRIGNEGDTTWLALPRDPRARGDNPHAHRNMAGTESRPLDYEAAFLAKDIGPDTYSDTAPVAVYRRYIEENHLQGMVTVGAQLWDLSSQNVIDRDYARGFLSSDVAPGETCDATIRMRAPLCAGIYCLVFDLVDEYVTWFGAAASPVTQEYVRVGVAPCDSRSPGRLAARIEITDRPAPGVMVVSVRNEGDTVWLHGPLRRGGYVQLGVQRLDESRQVLDRDWMRVPLPHTVQPGEMVSIRVDTSAAAHTGHAEALKLDLVSELRCWFEESGSPPLIVSARDCDAATK